MVPFAPRVSPTTLAILTVVTGLAAQESDRQDGTDPDPVVATVGTWQIRLSDLIAEVNRQIPLVSFHQRVPPERMREIRRDALDVLIERSLIHQDALARGIEITDAEVADKLREVLAKTPGYEEVTDEDFLRLVGQYRAQIERRLLLDENEARFESTLPEVDATALETAYEELRKANQESLLTPAQAHIQQVFLAVDPSSASDVIDRQQARAEEALAKLEAGTPFEDVARAYSEDDYAEQGGDMGVVKKADVRSATLREAAFALEAGEVSGLIRSLYGFHIVRCVEVIPRRQLTLEEVRPMLEAWWKQEHRAKARERWLSELRERYPVTIAPAELEARSATKAVDEQKG